MQKKKVKTYTVAARLTLKDSKLISKIKDFRPICEKIVKKFKFNVLAIKFHQFKPKGVTGFFLISQSHIAMHTWPEINTIFLEVSSSYDKKQVIDFVKGLSKELKCSKIEIKKFDM